MPGFNGTGPQGMGPRTGWGRGYCTGGEPAARVPAYGFGWGRGPCGGGRARGRGRGRGMGRGLGYGPVAGPAAWQPASRDLEAEAAALRQRLEQVEAEMARLQAEPEEKD